MERSKIFIPILVGTSRKNNNSYKIGEFIFENVKNLGFSSQLFSPEKFLRFPRTTPNWAKDENYSSDWEKITKEAKAFIFVIPEYNHGYPGELKLLLDQQYQNYENKPVLLCGVSSGGLGGARVVEHIKPVLIELGLLPLSLALYFDEVSSFLEDKQKVQKAKERLAEALENLEFFVKKLQG